MGNSNSKAKLRAQLANAERRNAVLKQGVHTVQNERDDAMEAANRAQEDARRLGEQSLAQEKTTIAQVMALKEQIAALTTTIDLDKSARETALLKAETLAGQVEILAQQATEERTKACEQQELGAARIATLEEKLNVCNADRETLLNEQRFTLEECKRQEKRLTVAQGQIADARDEASQKNTELLKSNSIIEGLSADCDKLNVKYGAARDTMNLLQSQLSEKERVLQKLNKKTGRLRQERDEALEACTETAGRLKTLKVDLKSTKAKLASQSSQSSAAQRGTASSLQLADMDFSRPVTFSKAGSKDYDCTQRVAFEPWQGEMRVEIREWYGSGGRSKKGVSLPVADAQRLSRMLPEVVRQAKVERDRQGLL